MVQNFEMERYKKLLKKWLSKQVRGRLKVTPSLKYG